MKTKNTTLKTKKDEQHEPPSKKNKTTKTKTKTKQKKIKQQKQNRGWTQVVAKRK